MSNPVAEIITFKLVAGVNDAAFMTANEAATDFLTKRKGFVSRRLTRGEDGTYTDYVIWSTLDDAQAAMEASTIEPSLSTFMASIDLATFKLDHQEVMVAVN